MTTRAAPPSPLKITPHDYEETPSSSAAPSPAESCASAVEKTLEPWEKLVSRGSSSSSVDSEATSEPLWEEDSEDGGALGDEEEQEEATMGEDRNASAHRMQVLVQTMQQRLQSLQQLVQEARPHERQQLHTEALEGGASAAETSSSCFSPVAVTNAAPASPGATVKDRPIAASTDRTDSQTNSSSSSSDEEEPPAMTTLLNRIKTLELQLEETADENLQLRDAIHRLEEENARLEADSSATAAATMKTGEGSIDSSGSPVPAPDQESNDAVKDLEDDISHLATAIFGKPSKIQLVMEQDLSVLKNHERCQHKLHELWETVRTLQTFVESYELERDAMRIQRDEAIADADRADSENAKLAGSTNTQQKIKYLQQVKSDNQTLRRKNRALNAKIAQLSTQLVREKHGCAALDQSSVCSVVSESLTEEDPATLDESQSSCDDRPERTWNQVLRSLWDRSGLLERRLERLRLERCELALPVPDTRESSASRSSAWCQAEDCSRVGGPSCLCLTPSAIGV